MQRPRSGTSTPSWRAPVCRPPTGSSRSAAAGDGTRWRSRGEATAAWSAWTSPPSASSWLGPGRRPPASAARYASRPSARSRTVPTPPSCRSTIGASADFRARRRTPGASATSAASSSPAGGYVFGINDWPAGLPEAEESREETGDGVELVEVVPDPVTMTCTHRVTLTRPDGRQERHALTRRHYSLRELRRLRGGKRIRPARRAPSSRRGTAVRRRRRGSLPLRRGAPENPASRIPRESQQRRWAGAPWVRARSPGRWGESDLSCPGQGRASRASGLRT